MSFNVEYTDDTVSSFKEKLAELNKQASKVL